MEEAFTTHLQRSVDVSARLRAESACQGEVEQGKGRRAK